MNKKLLLTTTMAGTMFVAGMANPIFATTNVKFDNAGWLKDKEGNAVSTVAVELSKENAKKMTIADLKAEVTKKYGEEVTITKIVGANGEEIAVEENDEGTVGTGAKVTLSNEKEMTVVVFGDVTGDGVIDVEDIDTIFYDKATLEGVAKKAGDLTDDDTIDVADIDRLFYYATGDAEGSYVDKAKLPDGTVPEEPLKLEFAIDTSDEEKTAEEKDGIKGISLSEDLSEITVKVVPEDEEDQNGKASFALTGITSDLSFSSEDGVIFGEINSNGKLSISVPNTAGTYTFKISKDGKSKTITVYVKDVTMSVLFKAAEMSEADMNSISNATVKENSNKVKFTKPTDSVNTDTTLKTKADYSGKISETKIVSDLEGYEDGLYYVAKLQLEDFTGDRNDLIVVKSDASRKYYTIPAPNTDNEIFVYLDASELDTEIVIALKDSTNEQIKAEQNKYEIKLTDNSNLKVLPDTNTTNRVVLAKLSNVTNASANKNQGLTDSTTLATVSASKEESNMVDIYARIEQLEEYSLGDTKQYSNGKNIGGDKKWIGIQVPMSTSLSNTTFECSTTDNIIVKSDASYTQFDYTGTKNTTIVNDIVVWAPIEKDGQTFTVHVKSTTGSTVEEADVKFVVHDASVVKVTNVELVDPYGKGVEIGELTSNNFRTYKQDIKVNVNKNSIQADASNKKEVALKITYNVPIDMINFASADSAASVHTDTLADNPNTMDNYEIFKFNVNQTYQSYLCNKLSGNDSQSMPGYTESQVCYHWHNYITITFNDTSSSKLPGTYLANAGLTKENIDISKLDTAVSLSQTKLVDTNLAEEIVKAAKPTFANNTFTINKNDYGQLSVNGVDGKWILVMLQVNDVNELVDNNEATSGIYINPKDAEALGVSAPVSSNNAVVYKVPVWINLETIFNTTDVPTSQNRSVNNIKLKFKVGHEADGLKEETNQANVGTITWSNS